MLIYLCSYFLRGLGPWGPDVVRRYTSARFGTYSSGTTLTEEESRLLTGGIYKIVLMNMIKLKFVILMAASLVQIISTTHWQLKLVESSV